MYFTRSNLKEKKSIVAFVQQKRTEGYVIVSSKVCERIIFKDVFNHLISNNLLNRFQSGFVPGHSTVHQLI
jgi:hypothetical protein